MAEDLATPETPPPSMGLSVRVDATPSAGGAATERLTSPLRTSAYVNHHPFAPSTHKVHHEVYTRDASPCASPATSPSPSPKPSMRSRYSLRNIDSRPNSEHRAHAVPPLNTSVDPMQLSQRFCARTACSSPKRSTMPSLKPRCYTNNSAEQPGSFLPVWPTSTSEGFLPTMLVPMPPMLAFESWWNEGKERVHVSIDYDTATSMCTASLHVAAEVHAGPSFGQATIEPWDLHVGAQLQLLGRRMTLKKARDAATLKWLDQQAFLLRRVKEQFEQQLAKFRLVGSYMREPGPRCEGLDTRCHAPTPSGGRTNLRNLRRDIADLAAALRQHQLATPPMTSPSGALNLPTLLIPSGSLASTGELKQSWSPQRWKEEAAASARSLEQQEEPSDGSPKKDWFNWIIHIPLAASAARLEKGQDGKYIDPATVPPVRAGGRQDNLHNMGHGGLGRPRVPRLV